MAAKKSVPLSVKIQVLTEAGYRCGVPTCRTILALDLHHMEYVSEGGRNGPGNLLALCANCHALHHNKIISKESIFAWKGMLVALWQAFDKEAIDLLLFLRLPNSSDLVIDGSGVLRFARLIAAGLASFRTQRVLQDPAMTYCVTLTPRGAALIEAWCKGDRVALDAVLTPPHPPEMPPST